MSELDTAIRQFRRARAFIREARCHANGGHDYERIWLVNEIGDLGVSKCRKCGATVSYQFGKVRTTDE